MRRRLFTILDEMFSGSPFSKDPLYRQNIIRQKMKRTLSLFASKEAVFFKNRNFTPRAFEIDFGKKKPDENQHGHLELDGKILIRGAIDRLDVMPDGKRALVVDYKLGERQLRKEMDKGLGLQLPIYLLAAKRVFGLEPVGAELRFLQKDDEQGIYLESIRGDLGFSNRKRMETKDNFDKILQKAESDIVKIVSEIQEGNISIRSKSCKYCAYNPVCRYEAWRLIYSEMENGK